MLLQGGYAGLPGTLGVSGQTYYPANPLEGPPATQHPIGGRPHPPGHDLIGYAQRRRSGRFRKITGTDPVARVVGRRRKDALLRQRANIGKIEKAATVEVMVAIVDTVRAAAIRVGRERGCVRPVSSRRAT